VHAGLWNQHTILSQSSVQGTNILSQPTSTKVVGNVIGLTVDDLKNMFDIPAFDLVYMDIEGGSLHLFPKIE